MNETEELIKAALAKHVERTPHPGPVLTALARRRRRVRPALIAIIAATAVAAGIAIPVSLQKPEASVPPATQAPLPVEHKSVPLRYTLDAPKGYVERSRSSDVDAREQSRTWMKGDYSVGLLLSTPNSPSWNTPMPQSGRHIDVNGVTGWISTQGNDMAFVGWSPEKDVRLTLSIVGPDAGAIPAVAQSVRRETSAVVQPVMSFGTVPPELTRTIIRVAGSTPQQVDTWIEATTDDPQNAAVLAKLVPRGSVKPASLTVAVPAPDGRDIQVQFVGRTMRMTTEQLTEIANGIRLAPAPDLSWVGR